ncbi:hypothetical protein HHI36_009377 [Cryptolaemus montrouzieri]|uniref:Uncharacterized protein n=1 Tax=Cryptolaemus montrouzieri TaxID=559131 RepID=A0ABD2MVA7_9CUCU
MLLQTQQLPSVPLISTDPRLLDQLNKRTWYSYSTQIEDVRYFVNVGHRNRTFSAEDLMGFNNTGNICIWPSEETLSYYLVEVLVETKFSSLRRNSGGTGGLYRSGGIPAFFLDLFP